MRRFVTFCFSLWGSAFALAFGDSPATELLTIPSQFYMGDTVKLQFFLEVDRSVVLTAPRPLPEANWMEMQHITISREEKRARIEVTFVSYATGTKLFPPLDLGGVMAEGLRVHTSSRLKEHKEMFTGIRPPLLLPGTSMRITLLGLIGLLGPFGLISLTRWGRRTLTRVSLWFQEKQSYRRMRKSLRKLRGPLLQIDPGDFYSELSLIVRQYLTKKTTINCLSTTTRELSRLSPPPLEERHWERFTALLKRGDRVRFGHEEVTREEMRSSLRESEEAASIVERRKRHAHF